MLIRTCVAFVVESASAGWKLVVLVVVAPMLVFLPEVVELSAPVVGSQCCCGLHLCCHPSYV